MHARGIHPAALWKALRAGYGHGNEADVLGLLYDIGPTAPPVPLFAERLADGLLLPLILVGPISQAE